MQKKILVSLFVFLSVLTTYSQTQNQIEERPANGPRSVKNIRDELHRRQGVWSTYNYDGDLISRVEYVNDKKEGLTTLYYPGGGPEPEKIKEETYYFAGLKDSTSIKKYISGQSIYEGNYEAGKKNGKWIGYYEDGTIKYEGNFLKGKRDGEWKFYNRKGALIRTTNFSNGVDGSAPKPASKKDAKDIKGSKPAAGSTPAPVSGGAKK